MTVASPIVRPPSAAAPTLWTVEEPDPSFGGRHLPVLATAIHAGHTVDPEVAEDLALSEEGRLREEDPGTDRFTDLGVTRVIVRRSRFEVDLNRPREGAVYADPDSAWGLDVWKSGEAPAGALALGRREHDEFYAAMEKLLASFEARFGRFVVYDVHSYNHRRDGADAPPADPRENPEINVGTGALIDAGGEEARERWAPVVERFMSDLAGFDLGGGRRLDVRENVRVRGGHFSHWIAERVPRSACPLAIEVKKIYMDEWTGRVDDETVRRIREALAATLPGVTEALARVGPRVRDPLSEERRGG
jgi:hypothetical protein